MNNPTQHRNWILVLQGQVAGTALALSILLGLAVVAASSAQAQNFTSFDAPKAGTGANQGTIPVSINTAGTITGIYFDASGLPHGFVRAANAPYTITAIDDADAGTGKNQGTFSLGINPAGEIAGYYSDTHNWYHGFVRAPNGTITPFDVPGALEDFHLGTGAGGIDTAGDVTGFYRDTGYVHHGFVRAAAAPNTITTFDAPGAGTGTYEGTEPIGMNTVGDIVGFYIDSTFMHHGFVRAASAPYTITTFDAPGVGTGPGTFHGGLGTTPVSINTAGDIAGTYTDTSGARHGFVRAASAPYKITSFDAPGAVTGAGFFQGTVGFSINTAGVITGSYLDASSVLHGFVRAANGTMTTFSAPDAAKGPGLLQGTGGFGINAAGAVTGAYTDASGAAHGFVLAPETATTTTLKSALNPSAYGQAVTFTATVTSKLGAPPDGESVSFMKGTTVLGTGTLSSGSASFTTSTLKVGTNAIKAVYAGDSNFAASTSKAVSQAVGKATTKTTLTSSVNPSNVGQSVTFTASVTPEFSGAVNGKVTFYDGTTILKTVTLSGGAAKFTTSTLTHGTHTITATYNGNTDFDGSSASLTQKVN